ncbi:Thiamine-monophosphate kinase [Zhongshania aliphaticivorans]|uniref:Thiamine-monophosphate kinase n=1 Tax=Zhongshania aliphaticivorans TaxID=1470434 RepID=A0A5S9NR50_9GAMM|nr:sll0787 family AIR synthase-like protein [Zhongshania aliphaticivorans]CAA0092986.1 Thiamine-monophosphate kinase [Zhongshania aliphaticivorans]CAA0110690.1 Thiamine-monophosphate kinase [Zhongshania aliphaticivorans]
MNLRQLLDQVYRHSGIDHKRDISRLAPYMPPLASGLHPNGDDAAALPSPDGYTLLAMEGFIEEFVEHDPWFAGWCGVMVNVSDIAAMGGRPSAIVNAIWDKGGDKAERIMQGMHDAATCFGISLVGGHTNLHANNTQLAVAIMGHAKQLLSSFAARPGQALVAAIDLRGEYRAPFLNWNAATGAPPARLRGDIALLAEIANKKLATAAKDISQAGLLGTTVMLLESSGVGAEIDLSAIPRPQEPSWADWLCSFPSFGYLLTCDHDQLPALLEKFHSRDIAAAEIGQITQEQNLFVHHQEQRELFWNLATSSLTGLGKVPRHSLPVQQQKVQPCPL